MWKICTRFWTHYSWIEKKQVKNKQGLTKASMCWTNSWIFSIVPMRMSHWACCKVPGKEMSFASREMGTNSAIKSFNITFIIPLASVDGIQMLSDLIVFLADLLCLLISRGDDYQNGADGGLKRVRMIHFQGITGNKLGICTEILTNNPRLGLKFNLHAL